MTLQNYKIWTNDGLITREDPNKMRHVNPQAAVEEFAETYDRNGNFYFARNTSTELFILCQDESGHITKWNITVEAIPQYYASEYK